ncbi:MAG TPA: hypothetical protein V6C81_00820 [Planktothrix sp.]
MSTQGMSVKVKSIVGSLCLASLFALCAQSALAQGVTATSSSVINGNTVTHYSNGAVAVYDPTDGTTVTNYTNGTQTLTNSQGVVEDSLGPGVPAGCAPPTTTPSTPTSTPTSCSAPTNACTPPATTNCSAPTNSCTPPATTTNCSAPTNCGAPLTNNCSPSQSTTCSGPSQYPGCSGSMPGCSNSYPGCTPGIGCAVGSCAGNPSMPGYGGEWSMSGPNSGSMPVGIGGISINFGTGTVTGGVNIGAGGITGGANLGPGGIIGISGGANGCGGGLGVKIGGYNLGGISANGCGLTGTVNAPGGKSYSGTAFGGCSGGGGGCGGGCGGCGW